MPARFFIILAVMAALPARVADAAREKIAVLGIEPRDDGDARSQARTAGLARALTDGMRRRAELPGTGYLLAPGSDKDLLELKLLSDCIDEAPGCMAAIGRDLGADVILFGNIEKRKDGDYAIWVRSLVTATKKAAPLSLVKTIPAAEATEDKVRELSAQVFPEVASAPLRDTTLVVETNVSEGTILVNGVQRGLVAAKRPTVIRGLPPGDAKVSIEAPGYVAAPTTVNIREGEQVHATVTMNELAPGAVPPSTVEDESRGRTERVLFWSTLVATGAGVAAFTITGLQVRSIENDQDAELAKFKFYENGTQFPDDACKEASNDKYQPLVDICDRGKRMATVTNVLIGVTAATAVAAAIFYWRGYLVNGPSSERTASRHKRKPASANMVWAPEIYSNGAGLGAVIQF